MLLLDKYILRRWTKNAKIGAVYDDAACSSFDEGSSQSLMARHGMLAHKASLLVDDASLTDARNNFLLGEFDKMHIKLKDIDDGGTVGMSKNRSSSREETQVVCDPNAVRTKDCSKRLKSSKEKALTKSTRQYRVCGVNGHDQRTCPKLQDRSNVYHPLYEHSHGDGRDDETYTSIASNNYESVDGFFNNGLV
ncbi:Protein FAR1-RELATED SEQUENCE [Abeliophyllum distichum]|uniref:Protein FAR1-RELATED SEQUENCE n=1 Tax=Abeliophyllum distichum TaxID=126358 RepID=A0ABD1QZI9_9LAMI